ncbi:VOC family protein [Cohnella sp. AR92]|uniref:VOC family protein n=1 Tax=Cohnella sp. AR92 TaxID=648716 RepID=UPI000F8F7262|nr:VOC family protein [Cohnella sp. AR92]RUS47930.1 VOC family protein [Cohnella sp. AR92]
MNSVFQRIDCNFIPVSNLEESINWYVEMLGCALVWKEESGYAALNVSKSLEEGKSANIEIGQAMITLVESENFSPLCFTKNGQKHPYMNFYTNEIGRAHQILSKYGFTEEQIIDEGNLQYFNFYEINGHYMGVCCF